jgi:hypothetical protein
MLGMLLLARRLLVFVENPVDKLLHRTPFRLLPLGSLTLRRNRILSAWRTMRRCTLCFLASW